MEGSTWVRLVAVFGLVFGALFILLPTLLAEDVTQAKVDSVQVAQKTASDPWVELSAGDEADAAATSLRARFAAARAPVERVSVERGKVRVWFAAGGTRDRVLSLATPAGARTARALSVWGAKETGASLVDALKEKPDGLGAGSEWATALAAAAASPAPADAPTVSLEGANSFEDGAGLKLGLDADRPDEPLVFEVDGKNAVIGVPRGERQYTMLPLRGEADADAVALLAGDALSAPLTAESETASVPEPPKAAAPAADVATTRAPAWLAPMLPNTKINLGLDLQGGIDLTLQVGIEDAVQAQVERDRKEFAEVAKKAGLEIEFVRERSRPVIKLRSASKTFAELQDWMRNTSRDYVYTETMSDAGGEFHLWALQETRQKEVETQAVEQVLETLRKRVDSTGVKEPSIVKKGGGRINVQLPGVVDLQSAIEAIGTQAVLDFRLYDHEFDESKVTRIVGEAEKALSKAEFEDDIALNEWLWSTGRLPETNLILWLYEEDGGEKKRSYPMPLKNEIVLSGGDVANARVAWDQNQLPYVALEFKSRGAQVFCDITTSNVGKQFAIVLDNQVRSAPNIKQRICGGSASIEMGSDADALDEANTLALVLRSGSLTAPVAIAEVRTVGPSLGADAIQAGSMGTLIGAAMVMAYMLLWYKKSGLVANGALVLNVLLVFASMGVFGATLTLPGIAGIALTVGMAVDANIIVFERIREELRLGVIARRAVDAGFDRAAVAIIDSNLTTALAGVVLYSYGSGPLRGFAVTLLVGIVTTLVTALFVTRTFMDIMTRDSSARLDL